MEGFVVGAKLRFDGHVNLKRESLRLGVDFASRGTRGIRGENLQPHGAAAGLACEGVGVEREGRGSARRKTTDA